MGWNSVHILSEIIWKNSSIRFLIFWFFVIFWPLKFRKSPFFGVFCRFCVFRGPKNLEKSKYQKSDRWFFFKLSLRVCVPNFSPFRPLGGSKHYILCIFWVPKNPHRKYKGFRPVVKTLPPCLTFSVITFEPAISRQSMTTFWKLKR